MAGSITSGDSTSVHAPGKAAAVVGSAVPVDSDVVVVASLGAVEAGKVVVVEALVVVVVAAPALVIVPKLAPHRPTTPSTEGARSAAARCKRRGTVLGRLILAQSLELGQLASRVRDRQRTH